MILCAGRNETFSFAHPIGVGLIESSINLTRVCLFDKPDFLLFVGTAGAYSKDTKIFDIIESSTASNIELSFFSGDSYTPLDNVLNSQTTIVENQTIVNSSNYISTNFDMVQNYLEHNIKIENMEFYSLLQVAKEFDIQIGGIFIVTNYCDENAHKDFIKNHEEAKSRISQYLVDKKIISLVK